MSNTKKLKDKVARKMGKNESTELTTFEGMERTQIRAVVEQQRFSLAQVVRDSVDVGRKIALMTEIIQNNPAIAKCDPATTMGALMLSQSLGLEIGEVYGEFYFVPRWNKQIGAYACTPMIGYKGLIKLVRNTGLVSNVYAHVVYEHDTFEYQLGLHRDIKHIPGNGDRGDRLAAYAVAEFKDGSNPAFEVMSRDEIKGIAKRAGNTDSEYSPWRIPEYVDQMWKKTVLRRLMNTLPMEGSKASLQKHIQADGQVVQSDSFRGGQLTDGVAEQIERDKWAQQHEVESNEADKEEKREPTEQEKQTTDNINKKLNGEDKEKEKHKKKKKLEQSKKKAASKEEANPSQDPEIPPPEDENESTSTPKKTKGSIGKKTDSLENIVKYVRKYWEQEELEEYVSRKFNGIMKIENLSGQEKADLKRMLTRELTKLAVKRS